MVTRAGRGSRVTLDVVIDEVVLVGIDPHDRHAIGDALAAHLEQALGDVALEPLCRRLADAGPHTVLRPSHAAAPDSRRPADLGVAVAGSIAKALAAPREGTSAVATGAAPAVSEGRGR